MDNLLLVSAHLFCNLDVYLGSSNAAAGMLGQVNVDR